MFKQMIETIKQTLTMVWDNLGFGNPYESGLDWAMGQLHSGVSAIDLELYVALSEDFNRTESEIEFDRGVTAACAYYGGGQCS